MILVAQVISDVRSMHILRRAADPIPARFGACDHPLPAEAVADSKMAG